MQLFVFVCRWATFRLMFEDIDANIRKLLEEAQDVKYLEHIGGGHCISVTTEFRCVDFRRWFLLHDEQNPKPTKKGVALRFGENEKHRGNDRRGRHWVSICAKDGRGEYFDSFGSRPSTDFLLKVHVNFLLSTCTIV